MNQITIDGKTFNLVPIEVKPEKEILICELDGYRYFLGPEAPEAMDFDNAIKWCHGLGKGFELPNRIVLLACFMNHEIKPKFKEAFYWSSTEFHSSTAWYQFFANGNQSNSHKHIYHFVRAVRKEDLK